MWRVSEWVRRKLRTEKSSEKCVTDRESIESNRLASEGIFWIHNWNYNFLTATSAFNRVQLLSRAGYRQTMPAVKMQ